VEWPFRLKMIFLTMERKDEALALLENYPDSEYKSALTLMVNYVVERKK
jgi:octaprenyl-diphosphate synthase